MKGGKKTMAVEFQDINIAKTLLFGIVFWVLATLLQDTAIFASIANLPEIGLFLGVLFGAFGKKLK